MRGGRLAAGARVGRARRQCLSAGLGLTDAVGACRAHRYADRRHAAGPIRHRRPRRVRHVRRQRAGLQPGRAAARAQEQQPAADPGAPRLSVGQVRPPQLAAPNNPQLGFIWSNIPKGFPAAVNRATGSAYSVTQQIPFPGKKSLAAEIADRQAESLNAQSDALYLQLYAQLSTTYYQAVSLQKQIDVLKLTIARLEQVKQITRVRYANNAAAYADYLNAQVSQSSAQNDLFAAQRQYDTTVQTLNTLIGKEPSFPLELRAEDDAVRLPGEPLPELENQALRQHPSIKASTELLDAARKSVTLARKGYLPDFQVIATVNSDNPPYGVRPGSYQLELDIIIPFWFFTKEKYAVNQAVESQIATEANDVAVRQQTLLAVDTAYSTLRQSLAQLDFNRQRQLPQALAAYRVTMTHYASNNADFNDLLTAQGALKNAELAVAQAQATALQAYHALLAATGRSPVQAQ